MRGSRGFDVASNRHSFAAKRTSFTKKRDLSEKVRGEFSSTLESGIEMTTFWGCSPSIFFFFFKFARGFPGVHFGISPRLAWARSHRRAFQARRLPFNCFD